MRKTIPLVVTLFIFAIITTGGSALSQQNPPAPTTPAGKAPGAAAQTAPSTKTAKPATAAKAPAGPALTTQKDKASYAIGLNIGGGLHHDGVDINTDAFIRGLKDALANAKPALSEDDMNAALNALKTEVTNRQQADLQKQAVTNKAAGDAFLAANKAKQGIVTLPSGLQYKILQQGTGPKPASTDTVAVNYRGTLLDGTEFDSSYKRGQPVTFVVNEVIRGWAEALPLMPVGSKWQLFIPSDLAYGERSPGPEIGPNSTLIFEVELVDIQGKQSDSRANPGAPPNDK